MAAFALLDVALWVGSVDMQSLNNRIALSDTADRLDATTFGDAGWQNFVGGLRSFDLSYQALTDYSAADVDVETVSNLNTAKVVSILEDPSATPAVGDVAHLVQVGRADIDWGGQIGELHQVNVSCHNRGATPLVTGELCLPKAAISASSNSAGSQVGALSATQTMYAALHVFATTGSPTLDVVIQSDTVGFPSPTSRITFTQATAATSEWGSVAGAVTDDYWRANYTFGGTGTITAAVTLGIATTP